ncbi:MAG: hypothetical protein IKU24_00180 [Clostridia bacterium]|nr:hypothetical protein [Clostridia bacterium]
MQNINFKKNLPILIILLSFGIIFLFFSEYDSNKEVKSSQDDFDEESYTLQLEERLCSIIEEIDGVSEVNVMVTLESGKRYTFAQEEKSANGSDITTFLMTEGENGHSSPILIETGAPKIKGVSVVCHGAENALIREKILRLVAGTLDLTQNKIYVTQ